MTADLELQKSNKKLYTYSKVNKILQETQDARRLDVPAKYSNCSLGAIAAQCEQR